MELFFYYLLLIIIFMTFIFCQLWAKKVEISATRFKYHKEWGKYVSFIVLLISLIYTSFTVFNQMEGKINYVDTFIGLSIIIAINTTLSIICIFIYKKY